MTQMEHFTMRLPREVITEMKEKAEKTHIPLRTLVRSWIMQKLEEEAHSGGK
jgi:predicted DNA binding CopG/RHH family protein